MKYPGCRCDLPLRTAWHVIGHDFRGLRGEDGARTRGRTHGGTMGSELFLVHRLGNRPLSTIRLKLGDVIVGRSSQADIYLPDSSVSRRHAKFLIANSGITVHDLNSRNGTFVDERRVQSAAVEPGQQIRFGAVNVLLSFDPDGHGELDSEIETAEPRNIGETAQDIALVPESLSTAQRRVLELLLKGLLEKQVAEQLCISQHTVHNHAREIYRAYQVHSRTELLLQALAHHETSRLTVMGGIESAQP